MNGILFSRDVLKSPKRPDICNMNVPRGFRFYIKNHVTLKVFQKEKSGLCGLERGPQSHTNFSKDGKASQDSIERGSRCISFFLHPPISLYFPFFPGIQARRRRGFVFTSVEATLKTDSMSLRRRDGIRVGRQRNAIPSGIRRAYTSSRKRRKYCVATNKNMYRVFREEFFSFLPSLPSGTRQHFLLHSE